MTVQSCVVACQGSSYALAGVDYARQCFCGNAVAKGSATAQISDCTADFFTGNSTQFCGGANRLLVYSM